MTEDTKRRLRKGERRDQILLELRLAPHVRVAELAGRFGVTTETIRRDIDDLGRAGLLDRSYGGASARAPGGYRGLDERSRERVSERDRLARLAVAEVREGDSLMIDAGSTTMAFARALALSDMAVTAVTNSLQVAMILGSAPRARVVLAPGGYRHDEAAVIGTATVDFLRGYHVDACFLGAAGIGVQGVSEAVEGFAAIKQAMLAQSARRHFILDASKFGRVHLSHVAAPGEIGTLVSDAAPTPDLHAALSAAGARMLYPDGG
ncbi:DeoR/GlpR transcriptional regulator [Mesobaculum littorinae]|uniref:DeoR/GlpR transcriptional regulator n=1 Tax=Mesobaculum littorinae TaxID=2486419 RepID=A0A438AJ36_9RHOB|nr:DeoR/GlpR family DNA-binding transcription regulator [Mesobaculum littorinae]RVV98702.1 DeoR/GlpR transcriptional regulator [Mesobaculum littorinae]